MFFKHLLAKVGTSINNQGCIFSLKEKRKTGMLTSAVNTEEKGYDWPLEDEKKPEAAMSAAGRGKEVDATD